MRRYVIILMFIITVFSSCTYATELGNDPTQIPSMSLEDYSHMMKSRQAKVDIIKKNNREVTDLKTELKTKILDAANKVNQLRIEITNEVVDISDDAIVELKNLIEFLQEAKVTLENDAEKISSEIEELLDLISTRSMMLEQYDLIIEKQNIVIIKMKEILDMVNKI